jgi:2-polyprenyl-3-methyl-5-hydroxy-6-metoxy-1,4-benzoquinol methylase
MLISEDYKAQNKELHKNPGFGVSSAKWVNEVRGVCATYGVQAVLDYGCGKGLLKQTLGWANIQEYDPAIEGKDASPSPAELVVCTDVLEHIEPDCLDSVLDDLKRCVKRVGFFTIATRPAKKTLPDGRNAHLIQESHAWWLPKLTDRFVLRTFHNLGGEFIVVVEAKNEA